MKIAIHECQSGHTMHRNRHRLQGMPGIINWIIVVVIWKNTVRMIRVALTAKQMEAPVGEDPVDAAARFQHRLFAPPRIRLPVEDLYRIRGLTAKSALETPAEDINFAVMSARCEMVSLRWQIRERRPFVRVRIINGEIMSARRAAPGDIDSSIHHRGDATAAHRW